ncbi:MAG: hypothetical protein M0R28_21370 [Pigmentiphaga sp.]|nr:hypothetical protein [Pigmentiphaga sp.]
MPDVPQAILDKLRKKALHVLRVRSRSMSSEIYGVLEEARVGRGQAYIMRGLRPGEKYDPDTDSMGVSPLGHLFPARKRDKPHFASAPGDPPARDTGRLMESVKVVSLDEQSLTALVGPDPAAFKDRDYYPLRLEFGTRAMAPRPFMRPALERFKQAIRSGEGRPT